MIIKNSQHFNCKSKFYSIWEQTAQLQLKASIMLAKQESSPKIKIINNMVQVLIPQKYKNQIQNNLLLISDFQVSSFCYFVLLQKYNDKFYRKDIQNDLERLSQTIRPEEDRIILISYLQQLDTILLYYKKIGKNIKKLGEMKYRENEPLRLQNSYLPIFNKLNLFKHQSSLKKLPIPSLENTINKYLESAKPYLNEAEFEGYRLKVLRFIEGSNGQVAAKELQNRLEEKANLWCQVSYLQLRDPLTSTNYFIDINKDIFQRSDSQFKYTNKTVSRAALLVLGYLDLRNKLLEDKLTPDRIGNRLLCSRMYQFIFNACRNPRRHSDIVQVFNPFENKHILVIYQGQFFTFDVFDEKGNPLELDALMKTFNTIIQQKIKVQSNSIGILTTENRDVWADAREKLEKSQINKDNLNKISSAIITVCLDDQSLSLEEISFGNNRYYDKPLQIIVSSGKCAINMEHSVIDGLLSNRCNIHVCNFIQNYTKNEDKVQPNNALINHLIFQLDEQDKATIIKAKNNLQNQKIYQFTSFNFTEFGKSLIKNFKITPDSFFQMALQLAYFNLRGKLDAVYQPAMTRYFEYGRIQAIRSLGLSSKRWVMSMSKDSICSRQQKINLLKEAVNQHFNCRQNTTEGQGIDLHFLGLQKMLQPQDKIPSLFNDDIFKKSKNWSLSTSTLPPNKHLLVLGFPPVVPGGLGLFYMIHEKYVSIFLSSSSTNENKLFKEKICQALMEMRSLFAQVRDQRLALKLD